jgi:hypothetical protein
VQGAVPVGAPAFTVGLGRRMRQTSMPRPIAVSYPACVMAKLACACDAERYVLRRGVAVRYFDCVHIAFSCTSSATTMTASLP